MARTASTAGGRHWLLRIPSDQPGQAQIAAVSDHSRFAVRAILNAERHVESTDCGSGHLVNLFVVQDAGVGIRIHSSLYSSPCRPIGQEDGTRSTQSHLHRRLGYTKLFGGLADREPFHITQHDGCSLSSRQ